MDFLWFINQNPTYLYILSFSNRKAAVESFKVHNLIKKKPNLVSIPRDTISNSNNSPIVAAHKESIFPTFFNLSKHHQDFKLLEVW